MNAREEINSMEVFTKRELFAAMAMQGMIAAGWNDENVPKRAVQMALDLLRELRRVDADIINKGRTE